MLKQMTVALLSIVSLNQPVIYSLGVSLARIFWVFYSIYVHVNQGESLAVDYSTELRNQQRQVSVGFFFPSRLYFKVCVLCVAMTV